MNKQFKQPDALNQVAEFHKTFGQPIVTKDIVIPSEERANLRVALLEEEVKEFKEAVYNKDIIEVIDALCDIQYVLSGAVLEFGLGSYFYAAFDEVHRSNMSKACVSEEEADQTVAKYMNKGIPVYMEPVEKEMYIIKRKEDDKVLKSINYSPANIYKAIKNAYNNNSEYAPHQLRVVEERDELLTKIQALDSFIASNPIYTSLEQSEQIRLAEQLQYMNFYCEVLNDRIDNF